VSSEFLQFATLVGTSFNAAVLTAIYYKLGRHEARIEHLQEQVNDLKGKGKKHACAA
jgi:hypothetical protein